MKLRYLGFIIAVFVASTTAGPINIDLFKDSKTCAKRCIDNHKFDYKVGNVYIYEYDAESRTGIVGATEDSATIRIKATVEIEPTSTCDFEMRLKEVSLVDPYRSRDERFSSAEFSEILTRWPLRFSYQDGRIEDLCPITKDPIWSLNVKRGILSAFQNSMTRLEMNQTMSETDITGSCSTKYTVPESGGVITKTKDFVSCKHRQGIHSSVQSIGYDVKSDIQCLAIMKSSYTCTQRISQRENILDESSCIEKHIFRPFSNGDNGAATINHQSLTYVRTKGGGRAQQDEIPHRTDLLFSHQFGAKSSLNAEEKMKMKLQELCQISQEGVQPEQPQLFRELIKEMKMADLSALKAIFKQLKNRNICRENSEKIRKVFRDAIPMVGTTSSLELIRDLILKKEVVELEKDMWLASLPFIQHPEKEMLSAIRPLLEEKNVDGNTILLISSLVSGYCSVNPNCGDVSEVVEIMDVFERLIGKCTSKVPSEKTMYALRAIGNIGHSKSIVPRLTRCFTRRENPVQIRLAAIDAFRRIPCDVMRVDLLDLFNDLSEDAELRINAYLALMKCPHKNILMRVREALREEKTNQVGSFVWTHLTNLKETSDPHLQGVREILEDEELQREFIKDKRKFSRNYEASFFLDDMNVGGKVDSNVIFSPKSFVPRSANLNLTIDLFGRAINFFEIGTRMEGVEHFLERYFGRNGYFMRKKPQRSSQKFPMKRFDDEYKVDIDALKGFAYVRMFGNELGFWQFEDPNLSFFKNFDIKKWVKDEKVEFSKNMALMDTQLIIPTIMGFPLNLTAAATASIDVEATGKMNLASFKNIEFSGSIKPSGAVKVVSEITVDAFVTKAGLRMNSMAHSSTEAKMSFKMKNSKVVESKFELPKKRMEIITLKSDFSIIKGDMIKEQKMIDDNKFHKNKCTGESFNKVTGLKLCSQVQFSNASMKQNAPYFPFTGPVVMQIELVNQDVPNGYIMRSHVNEATQSGFVIDTPNSQVSRKISLDIDVKKPEKTIEFDSPWKKVTFIGKHIKKRGHLLLSGELILDHKSSKVDKYSAMFQLDYSLKSADMKFVPKIVLMSPIRKMVVDGSITNTGKRIEADLKAAGFYKDEITLKLSAVKTKREYSCISTLRFGPKEYYLKMKVGMLPRGKATVYSPELLFIAEGKELIKLDSSFLYNPKSKIIASFKLDKVFSKIVALNARLFMTNSKKKMKNVMHVNLKGPNVAVDVKGNMELKESRFTSRVVSNYNIGKYQDRITISSKLLDDSTKRLALYYYGITVESKQNIKRNFNVQGRFGKADNYTENKFHVKVGNLKKKPDEFILDYSLRNKLTEKKINCTISFKQPSKNVDVGMTLLHNNEHVYQNVETDVEVKYAPSKTVGAKLHFDMKNKKNFEGFFSVKHLNKELFRLEDKLTSPNLKKYNNKLSVLLPGNKRVSLQSSLDKSSDKDVYITNTLRLPNNREVKLTGQMHTERENGSFSVEIDADRATLRSTPWNPKLVFDYHIGLIRQKFYVFRSMVTITMSPKSKIEAMYMVKVEDMDVSADLLIKTPFKNFRKLESKFTRQMQTYSLKDNLIIKIDDYYSYEEELIFKHGAHDFQFEFEYKTKQRMYDELTNQHIKIISSKRMSMGLIEYKNKHGDMLTLELNIDHLPTKTAIKGKADISVPRNGFELNLKSDSTYDSDEYSFISDSDVKLRHPRVNFEGSYSAQANSGRVSFETNFVSPTSRHNNGKVALDVAINDERTNIMGKFDVDYNDRRLYSLNTGYSLKDRSYNFQLGLLMRNGDRVTTVFSLSDDKVHAEIKLPRTLNSFELDMDGSMRCKSRQCDCKFQLTSNSPYIRTVNADMKLTEMGLIHANVEYNGFDGKAEFEGKIDGQDWKEKTFMASFKFDGDEKFSLEGDYSVPSPRHFHVQFMSKFGKQNDKFEFNIYREVVSSTKGEFKLFAMLELFRKKYEVSLMATDFKVIEFRLDVPEFDADATLTVNRLKMNDFDALLEFHVNSDRYKLIAFNRHFEEMKLSLEHIDYTDYTLNYKGGFDDRRNGNFQLKMSTGEYFIETRTTIKMDNQLELKCSLDFNVFLHLISPELYTGSGEIKLVHHIDSIFQKITGVFTYGKEKINFSSLVKNTGKINMNMRLKTTYNVNANLKAQIKPEDMYNTDLSLNFDTALTGSKKLTYSHSGHRMENLKVKAALEDTKTKETEYSLDMDVSMKNQYRLNIEATTDNTAKKYKFDGELTLSRRMEKGKLHIEAPFEFMDGTPIEISFNRDGAKFDSRGNFRTMEYSMDVEYSSKSIMTKAYINWDKAHEASNFNFVMNFDDAGYGETVDRKFELKLIHPVRTVSFSTKYVENSRILDVDVRFNGNVDKGQKFGFGYGMTSAGRYMNLVLPNRTYKLTGRVNTVSNKSVFESSFFWDFNKDDSKKIDLVITYFSRPRNAIFDVILKFPTQTKGMRLKSEISWDKGDMLFKGKTDFSVDQDPNNMLMAQMEILKDDNNKYTLTMALKDAKRDVDWMTTFRLFELNNKQTISMDMKHNHRNCNLMAYLDKNNNEIGMQMRSPSYTGEILGHYVMEDDYEISVKMVDGPKKPMEVYFNLSPSRKNLKIQVDYDEDMPEKSYRIDGNLLTNELLMVEAYRTDGHDRMKDIRMDFAVEDSQILHGKIDWRPGMLTEFNEFLYIKMGKNIKEMQSMIRNFYAFVYEEKEQLTEVLKDMFREEFGNINNYMSNEFGELLSETSEMMREVSEMYDRDYLYVKSSFTHLAMLYHEFEYRVAQEFSSFEYQFRMSFLHYARMTMSKILHIKKKLNNIYEETYRKLAYDIQQANVYVSGKLSMWNERWEITRDEYLRKLNELHRRTYQVIFNHKYTKALLMAFNHEWDDLLDFMSKDEMMYHVVEAIEYLKANMRDLYEKLEEYMDKIRNHPFMEDIFDAINELYQQLFWAYNYWEVEENVRNLDDKVKNYITSTANQFREQVFSMNDMQLLKFDMRRGEFEFKFPLVMPMFIVEYQETIHDFWQMAKHTVNEMNEWELEYNFTIADLYYSMKPSQKPSDWLPPFNAQASIFRDQHITTFDGVHMDFKGGCSYLLTRDFVDNNLTVIAHFSNIDGDQRIESVLFHAGNEKVELFRDYEARHNDQKMDLPITLSHLSVNRIGHKMEIISYRGFSVTFDPSHGAVIVDITGWYFGKMAGLFGTYNNEQFDDMIMPNQQLTNDILEFAFVWALPGCRSRRNYAQGEVLSHRCDEWFLKPYSPFRNCFRQVEPDSFYHACNTAHSTELEMCNVARFYVDRCTEKGVPVELPKQCMMCKTEEGQMFAYGEELTFSDNSHRNKIEHSADIVFVVEQRKRNEEIVRNLNRVIQQLEETLRKDGITDNRYGLVGFGGNNIIRAYPITIKSELMTSAGLIMNEVKKLEFYDGYSMTDTLKALSISAHYPFRQATRKTIVLVSGNMLCNGKTVDYGEVLKLLKDRDISLHLLQGYDFEMTGNKSPKTTNLYGVDGKQVFTKTGSDASEEMFETIKLPSGDCAELALSVNGTVFDARKMSQRDQTLFIRKFTRRIADSLETVHCQTCYCSQNEMGIAQSVCKRCPHLIEPYSSPFYLNGNMFYKNFQINENLKEELNTYWERFKKTP